MFGNSRVLLIHLIVKIATDCLVLQFACGGPECTQFSEDTGLD